MGFANVTEVQSVGGPDGSELAVSITAGSVTITSGTVTVSSISSTVTISGSVTITSGTVAVSAVSGTVTVAGSVSITSGSVSVSSVSGTVTVAGSVSISSGSVTVSSISSTVTISGSVTVSSGSVSVSAVSGTVTIAGAVTISSGSVSVSSVSGTVNVSGSVTISSGSVTIASGTVSVSSVGGTVTVAGAVTISSGSVSISSGAVTVSSGSVTVQNVGGTSLATTPTLTQQFSANKTFTNASPSQTFSVSLNSSDRVMALLLQFVSFTGTVGTAADGSMQASVNGGTTSVAYTNINDLPSTPIPVSGAVQQASPMIIPVYGVADSTVSITLTSSFPGYATYTAVYKVIALTAPDPGLMGSPAVPMAVQGSPGVPISVAPMGGGTKNALSSGTTLTIPSGYAWRIHSIGINTTATGSLYVTEGTSGLNPLQFNLASGRQTFFCEGMLFTGSFTPNISGGGTISGFTVTYDQVKIPSIV